MEINFSQKILEKELTLRKKKNSFYSLRAFARDLGIGSTTLSDVLANRRHLSKTNIQKVAQKLNLSSFDLELMQGKANIKRHKKGIERLQLEEDEFNLIADWYHLGILSLAKIKGCKSSPRWISKRFAIPTEDAKDAVTTLKRLGFIVTKNGNILRTAVPLSTTRDIPSLAVKCYHQSTLELAQDSLINDDVETREFSSITMAINPQKFPEAKEILMQTKRRISKLLETGTAQEVYQLSFQLFPLSKIKTRTKK